MMPKTLVFKARLTFRLINRQRRTVMEIVESFKFLIVSQIIFSGTAYKYDYYYNGCFRDAHDRDLESFQMDWDYNEPKGCFEWCERIGYEVAGVQYGSQCFCGHSFGKYGEIAEGFCDMECTYSSLQKCGGPWANSIYTKAPVWELTDRDELKGHLGCYKDSSDRDLDGYSMTHTYLHLDMCLDECKTRGFRYAGVQFKSQCFCGNSYGKHGSLPIRDCQMPCAGSHYDTCGGSYANNVYDLNYEHPNYGVCTEGDMSTTRCEGYLGKDTTPCPSGQFCEHLLVWFDTTLRHSGFCCSST